MFAKPTNRTVRARRNGRKSKKTDTLRSACGAGCSVGEYSGLN